MTGGQENLCRDAFMVMHYSLKAVRLTHLLQMQEKLATSGQCLLCHCSINSIEGSFFYSLMKYSHFKITKNKKEHKRLIPALSI